MLVVDFMHEFELGVFNYLFAHLIRILYVIDPHLVEELDHRYAPLKPLNYHQKESHCCDL
jgi:hypothetical protein